MSRHLPDCAGDDYCYGDCRYDGIPDPGILERGDRDICDGFCNPMAHHRPNCVGTPEFWNLMQETGSNPFYNDPDWLWRITDTWVCAIHGLLGDINGPVHYETCPRYADEETSE